MLDVINNRSLALTLLLGLATGCATTPTATADDSQTLPKASQAGFVAITGDCVLTPDPRRIKSGSESAGLVSGLVIAFADAVIPAATSFLFDRIAARAKAETLAKTASTTAKSTREPDDNLYSLQGSDLALGFGCVTFVRPSKTVDGTPVEYRVAFDKAYQSDWRTKLAGAVPGLTESGGWYPELLAEFRVQPTQAVNSSGDLINIGFNLEPVSLAYGATGAAKTGEAKKKDVGVSISISGFLADGKNGLVDKEIYAHQFSYPDLSIGSVLRVTETTLSAAPTQFETRIVPAGLSGLSGPIVALPQSRYKMEINGQAQELQTFVPLQATVIVTEFEEGGDFQRAIIKAIEEEKEKFTGPIDEALKDLVNNAVGGDEEES